MDPITAIVIAAVIAYGVASPDPVTLAATRGSAGAIGSMGRSMGRSINADRKARATRRSTHRQARLALLRRVRDNPKADPEKRAAARSALRRAAARDAAGAGVKSIGRSIKAGFRSMPEGYRSGAENARKKRRERRAKKAARSAPITDADGQSADETPASGGADTTSTTTKEDAPMADGHDIKAGDLNTSADLRNAVEEAERVAESFQLQAKSLQQWATTLLDRYAAADFGTKNITLGVKAVSDAAPDPRVADNLLAALTELRKALDEADALADVAGSLEAEGDVKNFEPV